MTTQNLTTTIKAHVRIEGGHLLSAKNAYRIQVRSTRATDRMGNRLPSSVCPGEPPYFQVWRMARHPKKGLAFIEVRNGHGHGGFFPNVRQAVMRALFTLFGESDYVVEVLPEDAQPPGPLPFHTYRGMPEYRDWFDGAKWCEAAQPKPVMQQAA